MDPEIQKALDAGYTPQEIASELQRRGLPVPPELLSAPVPLANQVRAASGVALPAPSLTTPDAGPVAVGAAGAGLYGGALLAKNHLVPKPAARSRLLRAVTEEGGPQALIAKIKQFEATGRKDLVLSDLGDHLASVADFAANANEPLRKTLSRINDERGRAAPGRLVQDVKDVAPAPGYVDAAGTLDQLHQEQQAFADSPEGYAGLRAANPALPPQSMKRLVAFTQSPQLSRAWADAASIGAVGPLPKADAMSFEVMQNLKERLDGLTDKAWRAGDGDLGRRLGSARDELVSILQDEVPNYRDVSAKYAQYANEKRAVEEGLQTWSARDVQLPGLQAHLASLGPTELERFRQGVLGGYLRDVENAATNRNFALKMQKESLVQLEKLKLIFGGEEGFAKALARYEQEAAMHGLSGIVGGSATHRRGMAGAAELDGAELATSAAAHGTPGVISRMASYIPKKLEAMQAAHLAEPFGTRGSEALTRLLQLLPK